jgi:hypothetical protein
MRSGVGGRRGGRRGWRRGSGRTILPVLLPRLEDLGVGQAGSRVDGEQGEDRVGRPCEGVLHVCGRAGPRLGQWGAWV